MSAIGAKGPAAPAQQAQPARHQAAAEAAAWTEPKGAGGSDKQARVSALLLQDAPRPKDAQQKKYGAAAEEEGPRMDPGRSDRAAAEAVSTLKDYLGALPSELKFAYDEETKRQVFKVVNPVTQEVVKQYPPEEFLSMVKRLKELDKNADNNGMLFDDRF
jgi:uncharacterized FlaG/YvyC family protein